MPDTASLAIEAFLLFFYRLHIRLPQLDLGIPKDVEDSLVASCGNFQPFCSHTVMQKGLAKIILGVRTQGKIFHISHVYDFTFTVREEWLNADIAKLWRDVAQNVSDEFDRQTFTITLDKYQRDNLLWLINACGYPDPGISPFTAANTGDWLGEIALKLSQNGRLTAGDRPNLSLEELRQNVKYYR